jgi:pimeloyl-ACP methyl ester carboxylesterase
MDFVLLHGTTQTPGGWDPLAGALARRGSRSVAVDFPVDRPGLLADDYATVAAHQAEDVRDPVVVAHSAAGVLAPAVARRLGARHLVWLAAVVPEFGGRSFADQVAGDGATMFGAEWHRWTRPPEAVPVETAYFLFHDCDLASLRGAMRTVRLFSPRAAFAEPPDPTPPDVPSTYVVATADRTLTSAWTASAARERLGTEPVEIDAGHCPHVSRPEDVADVLSGLAA